MYLSVGSILLLGSHALEKKSVVASHPKFSMVHKATSVTSATLSSTADDEDLLCHWHSPDTSIREPAPALDTSSRTPLLPPLPFQLPQAPRPSLTASSSAPVLETPNRPLLMRSVTPVTSVSSSSFYSDSTLSLEPEISIVQSFISSGAPSVANDAEHPSPLRISQSPARPEIPRIPERWQQASERSWTMERPKQSTKGLKTPTASFCTSGTEEAQNRSRAPPSSQSWETSHSELTNREPFSSCHPILPLYPDKAVPGPRSKIDAGRVRRRDSYENLRKGHEDLPADIFRCQDRRWEGFDDRLSSKPMKKVEKRRESRIIVQKRQP